MTFKIYLIWKVIKENIFRNSNDEYDEYDGAESSGFGYSTKNSMKNFIILYL